MKTIDVKKEIFKDPIPTIAEVSARLDSYKERNLISELNWKGFDYKPDVQFVIAYTDKELLLKYWVREEYFKAEKTLPNEMVCEDSCVEFFVSPADDGIYYNIEFNAIGTCLIGCGTGRQDSKRISPDIISRIRRLGTAGTTPFRERKGHSEWTLTLAIPYGVFFRHDIHDLKGKTFRANFYKCGDMLSVPHYVTWNPVGTSQPDYHQPAYFGLLRFI
ncbi:MAG: carbohydrate-binding family 9-like protein [Bacteroidales bacterium]